MTGTVPLLRFNLSRDRARVLLTAGLMPLMVVGVASSWDRLYPTAEERLQLTAILSGNPALTALLGPLNNPLSTGGLTAWRIGVGIVLVLGLVNIFTVTRHVRAEEQSGRAELLLMGRTNRVAPLWAALGVTLALGLLYVVLASVLLIAVGLPAASSVFFAVAGASCAMVFAGVAAVTNQIARTSRAANAVAGGVLAATLAVAGLGNLQDNALVWLSPFGWINRADAYGSDSWAVVGLALATTAVLIGAAFVLQRGRDVGGGLIADRHGSATAGDRLTGPHSLAWRLERPMLAWWAVGYAAIGLFIGSSRDSLTAFVEQSPALNQIIEALGGSSRILDAFLATYIGIGGVVASFLVVALVLRLRAEEAAGHTALVFSTATRRSRWVSGYTLLAIAGGAAVMLTLGVALAVSFALLGGDGPGAVPRILTAALAWVPALIFVAGLTLLLVGALPRWAGIAWLVVAGFALLTELGPVFGLPDWLVNLSPLSHVPNAPAADITVLPLLLLTIAGIAMLAGGYLAIQVRDVKQ